ncbi:hypothetical protein AARAC_011973, partial [Aspergillus arachidicola]
QARDKPYLFLDKLHADVACGPTLTSLFIQRSTYFAFFGKQISVDAVDVNSMHKEQATTDQPRPGPEQSAGGHPRPELIIVDEDHQQDRLENLRRTADEQEARLEQLTQRESDQQENIAQVQNAVSKQEERLMASSRDVEALQEKLDSMRRVEAEQVIRLESLEADEEKRRTLRGTLEQTQHELGEEIQLDLLAAGQQEQALRDDEAQTARLKQLSEEEQENQRNLDQLRAQTARQQAVLDQLAATERERKATLEQVEAEERRMYTVVAELLENARQLSDEEKIQAESWARIENEHKSVVDKLVARELELRGNIDQLAACLERLQAKIKKATKEYEDCQQRSERLPAIEREEQSAMESHESESQGSRLEPGQARLSPVTAEEEQPHMLDTQRDTRVELEQGSTLMKSLEMMDHHVKTHLRHPRWENSLTTTSRHAKDSSVGQVAEKVGIKFKLYEDGEWQLKHTLMLDASEPSELRRVVIKYMRKGYGIFDSQSRALTAQTCFERVTSDGTNVIHLAPEWEVFISVVALLAPVVLAAPQAGPGEAWISLIQEQCLDIAKKVHAPGFNLLEVGPATQAMPTCTPAYVECIKNISGVSPDASTFPQPDATQGQLAACLLQLAPDHVKYFLDNDKASTPLPASQNCALRELHRVAHVELGPLA